MNLNQRPSLNHFTTATTWGVIVPSLLFLTPEGWMLFWHSPPLLPTQTRSVCLPAADTWSRSCGSWGSQHLPLSWLVSGLSWSSGPHIPLFTQWPWANSLKCQSDQGTLEPKSPISFHYTFALKYSLALWNGPAHYLVFTFGPHCSSAFFFSPGPQLTG